MKMLNHRSIGLLTTSFLLAGVSALSPASVRAGTTCSFGSNTDFAACSPTFTFDQQLDKILKLVTVPTVGNGTIQFTQQTPGLVWVVDVDFVSDLMPTLPGYLEYDLTIAPGFNKAFLDGGLAIIGPPVGTPTFMVTKAATGLPTITADQTDPNATALFDDGITTTRVRDDYSVTTGSINSFQNSFTQTDLGPKDTVPGPLPLLGAGAAFGFSRRLRTRVLAARRG